MSQHTPRSAYRLSNVVAAGEPRELPGGVPGAPLGVEDDLSRQQAARRDRHRQRGHDQTGAHVVGDGPTEYPTRASVADRAQIQPALPVPGPWSGARPGPPPWSPG